MNSIGGRIFPDQGSSAGYNGGGFFNPDSSASGNVEEGPNKSPKFRAATAVNNVASNAGASSGAMGMISLRIGNAFTGAAANSAPANKDKENFRSIRMQRFDSRVQPNMIGVDASNSAGEEKEPIPVNRNRRIVNPNPVRRNREREAMLVPHTVRVPAGTSAGAPPAFMGSPPRQGWGGRRNRNKSEDRDRDRFSSMISEFKVPQHVTDVLMQKFSKHPADPSAFGGSGHGPPAAEDDGFEVDEADMQQLFEKYGGKFYRAFPIFPTKRYADEYWSFQRSFFSTGAAVFMISVVAVVMLSTEYAPKDSIPHHGRPHQASMGIFYAWLIFASLYSMFMCLSPIKPSIAGVDMENTAGGASSSSAPTQPKPKPSILERLQAFRKGIERYWIGRNFEWILAVAISISVGLRVIAFVDDSIEDCTGSGCSSQYDDIPGELILSLYLVPISAQLVFKGLNIRVVILTWILSTIFICVGLYNLFGRLHASHTWILILSTLCIFISFEYERFVRLSFVHSKVHDAVERARLLAVDEKNLNAIEANRKWLEHNYQMERAELERKTVEQESAQLRSLIGNVAHDLKTPLQSLAMGMEVLRSSFRVGPIGAGGSMDFADEALPPEEAISMLESLIVTCSFMSMAINRAVDFTKASSGIDLVPHNGTFDIMEAVDMPIACINNVQSTIKVEVEPLPSNICSTVISDRHWFCENILCLLSNAVKYSDGGTVHVILEYLERHGTSEGPHDPMMYCEGHAGDRQSMLKIQIGPMIRVTIEDTGIGLSPEARKTLFRPFKQAQRMTGGTGLGLFSMSKRIEALGGMYGIKDRRDGKNGSGFWFAFPYRPDQTFSNAALAELSRIPSIANVGGREMVDRQSSIRRSSSGSVKYMAGHGSDSRRSLFLPPSSDGEVGSSSIPELRTSFRANAVVAQEGNPSSGRRRASQMVKGATLPTVEESQSGSLHAPAPDLESGSEYVQPKQLLPTTTVQTQQFSTLSKGNTLRFLLVDDALSILKVTGKSLRVKGHTAETASNGSIALNMLKNSLDKGSKDFDVVLMDLQMPVMDGFECVQRFREYEAEFLLKNPCTDGDQGKWTRRQMIIGASANSDAVSRQNALDVGMDFFIPKPYTYKDILPILRTEGLIEFIPGQSTRPSFDRVAIDSHAQSQPHMGTSNSSVAFAVSNALATIEESITPPKQVKQSNDSETELQNVFSKQLFAALRKEAGQSASEQTVNTTGRRTEEGPNADANTPTIDLTHEPHDADTPDGKVNATVGRTGEQSGGVKGNKATPDPNCGSAVPVPPLNRGASGKLPSLRILLVDDALSILKVTGKTLQLKGHRIETAQNGDVALKRLINGLEKSGEKDLDVVLMDLQMPVMDGFDCVRKYREYEGKFFKGYPKPGGSDEVADASEPQRRSQPTHLLIIGASANSDDVSRQSALDAGMDFFIPKPYTYADILPILLAEGLLPAARQF